MKKLIVVIALLCLPALLKASGIGDQYAVALLSHTETIAETKTNGIIVAELLATPIQIGKVGGEYIVGLDGGVMGDTKPQPDQRGVNWTAGIHAHLTPIIKKAFTTITPNYPALTSIEINPRISWDFTTKKVEYGLGIGWAFGLQPLQ